jgi:hypothetical protein
LIKAKIEEARERRKIESYKIERNEVDQGEIGKGEIEEGEAEEGEVIRGPRWQLFLSSTVVAVSPYFPIGVSCLLLHDGSRLLLHGGSCLLLHKDISSLLLMVAAICSL